jgi:hypothetical protein
MAKLIVLGKLKLDELFRRYCGRNSICFEEEGLLCSDCWCRLSNNGKEYPCIIPICNE